MKKNLFTLVLILSFVYAYAQLPDPGFEVDSKTAILITDPQIDFLSPDGVTWGVVGKSVEENNTVANIERVFQLAEGNDIPVFISPHYYYPHDHQWKFEGALEKLMHNISMFDRSDPLSLEGFENSGADFIEDFKDLGDFVNVIVKIYGQDNRLVRCGSEKNDMITDFIKRADFLADVGGAEIYRLNK